MNEIREIIYRLKKQQPTRQIARELTLARNTVRKYRDLADREGFLDKDRPLPDPATLAKVMGPPPPARHMRSSVEPYKEIVERFVRANVEMMAIYQRLRDEHGYTGSYSSVRRFIARRWPKTPEAVCRVETEPGQEAQVDFGSAGLQWDARQGRRRRAWVFVMTLSWSRHQYVEVVFDQKIETFLSCHERAFAWFGGVVGRVVIDNLKAGVVHPDLRDPVLGEPYRRLGQHYGFVIRPHRPHTPRHKGKVESGVHYVKRNFLAGQEFADLEALNHRARQWVLQVAGLRCHGTTRQAPLARFHHTERAALGPLPDQPFDLVATYRAKIHRDCHVVVDRRYYSVPCRLIGRHVDVYVGRRIVEIYDGADLVTTHPVAAEPGGRQTRREHYPADKRAFLDNPPQRCLERASRVGPDCARLVGALLAERPLDRLRSVQSLLRLSHTVGRQRLEAACRRALNFGDGQYRRVKQILKAGLEDQPIDPSQPPEPARTDYRYARDGHSFFQREAPSC